MPLLRRCLTVPVAAVCLSSYAAASEVELNGKQFTIADGFTLELAAGTDLTSRPICVDFDDQDDDRLPERVAQEAHRAPLLT